VSILDLEIATQFGALDTDALTDGGALHAHALRQLAMSSHRLAERGGPMVQLMWDSSTDVAESETIGGALLGYAVGQSWIPLYVGPVAYPKKPNARTATAKIMLEYANGSDVFVCVQTSQADLTSDLSALNVIKCRGTGSLETYTLEDIPMGTGSAEPLAFWIRPADAGDLMDTATYGSPNTGTPELVQAVGMLDNDATWNTTSSGSAQLGGSNYSVVFLDADTSYPLIRPRRIAWVQFSGRWIQFEQPLNQREQFAITQSIDQARLKYEIRDAQSYRLASIAVYADAGVIR